MADHSVNALRAMIKSLEDIVAPAVDPTDPIAREQLQSAVRYLQFLEVRLDFVYDRERFELGHHLRMATAMLTEGGAFPNAEVVVRRCVDEGNAVYQLLGANVPTMRAQTTKLAAAIRMAIQEAFNAATAQREAIDRIVLDVTEERIELERSWYLPLGFEHSPDDVVPLQIALHPFD
jgi:hypothetical protein